MMTDERNVFAGIFMENQPSAVQEQKLSQTVAEAEAEADKAVCIEPQCEESMSEAANGQEEPTPEEPTIEGSTPEGSTPEEPTPEDPTPEDPTPTERGGFMYLLRDILSVVISAIVIAVALKAFVVDSRIVPTGSMIPTIHEGDRVIILRLPHLFGKRPARQDVVVFAPGEEFGNDDDLLKRVIGLPGDTVEIKSGLVYVNGEALDEPYINEPRRKDYDEVTVPEDCYFMLGDNRNHSRDSAMWLNPFVPFSDIKGKVILRYWPIRDFGIVE